MIFSNGKGPNDLRFFSLILFQFRTLSELSRKDRNSKIDVTQVIDIFSKNQMKHPDERGAYAENLNILESILSKQFPPERYNGVLNVIFVCSYDVVPTEDIQSALVFNLLFT